MNDQAITALIALPGLAALVWAVLQATVLRYAGARRAAKAWPAEAERLGLESFQPEARPRTTWYAGMRGSYKGRAVTLRAGLMTTGGGSNSSAFLNTTWITAAEFGVRIRRNVALDRLLPQSDATTGDAAFDKEFFITGEPEAVSKLTPEVREAILTYTRTLGDFTLDDEGLSHSEDAVIADSGHLVAVLDLQAWLLDLMSAGKAAPPPAVHVVPRRESPALWAAALLVMFLSLGGSAAYRNRAGSQTTPSPTTEVARVFVVGDRVLADYQGSGTWYAGVVVGIAPSVGTADVVYVDGGFETLPVNRLAPDWIQPGTPVNVPWEGGQARVKVERRQNDVAFVRFESDGKTGWWSIGQLNLAEGNAGANPEYDRGPESTVFAPWKDEPGWVYAGEVVERDGERVLVAFHDGSSDWRPAAGVRPASLEPGTACEFKDGDVWKPAKLVRRLAHALEVEADSQTRWTALSLARFPAP